MKKLLFIILILFSCNSQVKKPFIVTFKAVNYYTDSTVQYEYEDATGISHTFRDFNKYNIGDTLK